MASYQRGSVNGNQCCPRSMGCSSAPVLLTSCPHCPLWMTLGVLPHNARTLPCSMFHVHPTFNPLNGPHRTTSTVPMFALCCPCWHIV